MGARARRRQRHPSHATARSTGSIATVFAARARQEAVRLNRMGDYRSARVVLEATARRIRGYAGGATQQLRRIADDLAREDETFEHQMPERSRKVALAQSAYALQSRAADGAAMRSNR